MSLKSFYRDLADRSDTRARKYNIDPPRPGRKTYQQRINETRNMTTPQIDAKIAERERQDKECGVLYRVRSERS